MTIRNILIYSVRGSYLYIRIKRLLLTYLKTVPALKGFHLCLRNQNWVLFSNYMFWTNEHGRSSFFGLIHRSPTQQIIFTHPLLVKLIYHQPAAVTRFNPLTATLFKLNFHSLEVVSRWRDPQLQVSENYSDLTMEVNYLQILLIDVTFYFQYV